MAATTNQPPLTFSTFLISLASSALAHLGQVDAPGANPTPVDPQLARQTLDLIDLLAEKTKGNLDADEQKLLETLQRELTEQYGQTRP